MAILLSFLGVLAYLAYRFEWRFGLAAVLATAHDIVLTVCFIAVARIELSLVVVAAVLSMVGYSLNDTIIIFDRVRENMHKFRRTQLTEVLNLSINETLPRSILTHATTLVDAAGADDLRRRGHPAVRAGDVLRRLHRHLLVDLDRGADPAHDRAEVARRRRPRRQGQAQAGHRRLARHGSRRSEP
ncbi:MAG: protein translocase subunit SecF [Gemmatimonadales bacterium]